jgi:hypothetical protein
MSGKNPKETCEKIPHANPEVNSQTLHIAHAHDYLRSRDVIAT